MLDEAGMEKKMADYGYAMAPALFAMLDRYADFLVEYNQNVNLTAITVPEEVENKHMVDCLLLAMQPELAGKVVDVGSGAGFPGLVLKAARPELTVTLMEPTGKRCDFLHAAASCMGIGVDVVKERAEEAARKQWRESFDVAVARAVAGLPVLCEYCLPLLKPGGVFIAMKGEAADGELALAAAALQKLGGVFEEQRRYTLPDSSARSLIFIRKTTPTPPQYPRNGGRIAKTPL